MDKKVINSKKFLELISKAAACLISYNDKTFITYSRQISTITGNEENVLAEVLYYNDKLKQNLHCSFWEGDFDDGFCTMVDENTIEYRYGKNETDEKILIRFLSPTKINP